jgi:hypothetical protein
VHAPEALAGIPGVLDAVIADQRARGVRYQAWMEEDAAATTRTKSARRTKGKPGSRTTAKRTAGATRSATALTERTARAKSPPTKRTARTR